jgi:predicted ATPase
LSHTFYGNLAEFVRFETMIDLFYDRTLSDSIRIEFDDREVEIIFKDGNFIGKLVHSPMTHEEQVKHEVTLFWYSYGGQGTLEKSGYMKGFKYYRFNRLSTFPSPMSDFLLPPDGKNLLHIILTMKELKKAISELFKKFGYRLVLNPAEGKIEIQKDLEDVIVSVPYALSSETLQRMAFYLAAIYSNKDSIMAFEEPEAHAFPYYTKYLAERIAMDSANNQYFIATHNPYFLTSIMEKTPKNEIATFVTYFEDYQTKVKALSGEEIEHALAMGSDVFFNIEHFLEKDAGKGN